MHHLHTEFKLLNLCLQLIAQGPQPSDPTSLSSPLLAAPRCSALQRAERLSWVPCSCAAPAAADQPQ